MQPRCPKCNRFGTFELNNYCKACAEPTGNCPKCGAPGYMIYDTNCREHSPANMDCPKCGAYGYPKYNGLCKKCAGIKEDDIPLLRDTFYPSTDHPQEDFFSTGEFPCVEKSLEKEAGF